MMSLLRVCKKKHIPDALNNLPLLPKHQPCSDNVMFCPLRITISLMKNSTDEMRVGVRLHNTRDTIVGSHTTLK